MKRVVYLLKATLKATILLKIPNSSKLWTCKEQPFNSTQVKALHFLPLMLKKIAPGCRNQDSKLLDPPTELMENLTVTAEQKSQ